MDIDSVDVGPTLKYTDEQLHSMIKERFLKDARIDAAIDLYIFNDFSLQHPGRNLWDKLEPRMKFLLDLPKLHSPHYSSMQTRENSLQEKFMKDINATGSFFDTYEKLAGRFMERCEYMAMLRYNHPTQETDDKMDDEKEVQMVYQNEEKDVFVDQANAAMQPTWRSKHLLHMELPGTGPKKLQDLAQEKLFENLREAFKGEKEAAVFACGGTTATASTEAPLCTLWFETSNGESHRLDFPATDMNILADACSPVSFGFQGQDVVNPSYLKLDNTKFATNFHPYDHGIVDAIQQMLLPTVLAARQSSGGRARVVTDLYKLNIYAGSHDLFRPHVDTPRSETQFGSLVICLPSPHEGGNLLVRHKWRELDYDWGEPTPCTIKWAAFYSDCEHEVLQVRSGFRCTLTYNLSLEVFDSIPRAPILRVATLPLFAEIHGMLSNPGFMRTGGVIGFYTDHQYQYADKNEPRSLPGALKGVDAALYTIFEALGVAVAVRPLRLRGDKKNSDKILQFQKTGITETKDGSQTELPVVYEDRINDYVARPEDFESVEKRLEVIKYQRVVKGYYEEQPIFIGSRFCPVIFESLPPKELLGHVQWINEPWKEDHQTKGVYFSHGDGADTRTNYSRAVVFAIIPPYSDRGECTRVE